MKVVLKPSQCSKPLEAIKEQLYSMLYVYNGKLVSGRILSFISIMH